jgi:hypothetical protein
MISHVLPDLIPYQPILILSACLRLVTPVTAEHLPQRQQVVGECEAARLGRSNWNVSSFTEINKRFKKKCYVILHIYIYVYIYVNMWNILEREQNSTRLNDQARFGVLHDWHDYPHTIYLHDCAYNLLSCVYPTFTYNESGLGMRLMMLNALVSWSTFRGNRHMTYVWVCLDVHLGIFEVFHVGSKSSGKGSHDWSGNQLWISLDLNGRNPL